MARNSVSRDYARARVKLRRRLIEYRGELARAFGIDGSPDSQPRFLNFAAAIRFFLILPAPLLFLVPEPGYSATWRRWVAYLGLLVWTVVVGRFNLSARSRHWFAVVATDLSVCFIVFALVTRVSLGLSHSRPTYLDLITGGPFHAQTYAPLVTAGALLGAGRAFRAGMLAVLMYFGALWLAGAPPTIVFAHDRVGSVLLSAALYPATAVIFGAYSSLLENLRVALRRGAERGEALGEERARERLLAEMHDLTIGRLHTALGSLQFLVPQAEGELRDNLQNLEMFIRDTLDRAYADQDGDSGSVPVLTVLRSTVTAQALANFPPTHPVVLRPSAEAANGSTIALSRSEAKDLERIVGEAIKNAKKYARQGEIVIRLDFTSADECSVGIADPGVDPAARQYGAGRGQVNMRRRAARHGWSFDWVKHENGSCLSVLIRSKQAESSE